MNRLIQKSIYLVVAGVGLGGLCACGGDSLPTPMAVVLDEPVVLDNPAQGLSAQLLPGNKAKVNITGTGAGSYCVRTDRVTPPAADACFKVDSSQTVSTLGSATQATPLVIWSKNSAGVVAKLGALAVPGKTCSQAAYDASANSARTACVITDSGELVFALEEDKAPLSVANFLKYVNEGFYNGTNFHRLTLDESFKVAQGGGFKGADYASKQTTYPSIKLEVNATLPNKQYSVAMARGQGLDTATSQFFINLIDNPAFTGSYAVFAQIIFGQTTTLADMSTKSRVSNPLAPSGESASRPTVPLVLQWAYQIK